MAIKKQKDGTYTVSYSKRHPLSRLPHTKRRYGVKTKAEANRVYSDLVVQVSDLIKKKTTPTWSAAFDGYIKRLRDEGELYKSTVDKREGALKKYAHSVWADKYMDEIKTQDIRDFMNSDVGELSESHRKFILKTIRGVFENALEGGFISRNPTPKVKFKIADKIMTVLKEEQIIELLRRAQEQDWAWYPHCAVALYTGLRSGEMHALTWNKVDLKNRQILVNCAWGRKDGIKSTKSGDDRVVEIPKPLLSILNELYINREGDKDFVLPRSRKWDYGEQARELRMFLKSIELPEVRFHDLRASWATLLLSKNVAPSKVMSMGGWKKMETMMIYMRKAGIDIKGATSCLDEMEFHGVESAKVIDIHKQI